MLSVKINITSNAPRRLKRSAMKAASELLFDIMLYCFIQGQAVSAFMPTKYSEECLVSSNSSENTRTLERRRFLFCSRRLVFLCACVEAATLSLCRTHRVEVVEEAHAVRRRGGRLHWELQEGLHVQMRLDHRRCPQERRHRRPGSVYSPCTEQKDRNM